MIKSIFNYGANVALDSLVSGIQDDARVSDLYFQSPAWSTTKVTHGCGNASATLYTVHMQKVLHSDMFFIVSTDVCLLTLPPDFLSSKLLGLLNK